MVVSVLAPTFNAIADEAAPLFTVVPFTVIVAIASAVVGVTVNDVMALLTEAVYVVVPDAKTGLSVPVLKANELKFAFDDAALVTATL